MTERMKIIVAIVVCFVVAGINSVPAAAASEATQEVRGKVLVPSGPYRTGYVLVAGGVYLDACRFVGATTRWAVNRHLAYEFDVDQGTHGRPFVITTNLPADVDIIFVDDSSRKTWVSADRVLGTETGRVPKGADRAAVCLFAGPPTHFRYRTR